MAALSWDMGCRLVGKLSSIVTTWEGSAARLAHSRDTQFTCGETGLSLRAGGLPAPLPGTPAHYLLLGGHLSRHQQPEEPLGQRLLTPCCFGQQLLALGDAVPAEADALKEPRANIGRCSDTHTRQTPEQGRTLPHRDPARRSRISAPSCPSSRRTPGEGRREEVTRGGAARQPRCGRTRPPPLTMSTVICPMAVLPCCCLKFLIFACSLGIMFARTSFRFWERGGNREPRCL